MARRRKRPDAEQGGVPSWLLTYGDCVTLMLTFFVLLCAMSKVDESRRLVVLGSVFGTTGFLDKGTDVLATRETRRSVEPGPLEDIQDFEPLKDRLWEPRGDVRFESNKVVQVLSIGAAALFKPGTAQLSADGQTLLTATLPVLRAVPHPVLVAGHAGPLRDEHPTEYTAAEDEQVPNPSWRISLDRALAVYRFLLDGGVSPDKLSLEGFGNYRPHFSNADPKERAKNRRVDLVLDLRNPVEAVHLLREAAAGALPPKPVETIEFQGFRFEVNSTAPEPGTGRGGRP